MEKNRLSWEDIYERAERIADEIGQHYIDGGQVNAYGIPRGGIPAAQAVKWGWRNIPRRASFNLVETPQEANVYIDDIIDSGATRAQFADNPFYALVNKQKESGLGWVEFPWERMTLEAGPEENIRRIIEYIGDDPDREGLLETPGRVVKSYAELFVGYDQEPSEVIKTFEDGACDEMVIVRGVEFMSFCEHHMLPFIGTAHIAYVPDEKVIGVSKLVRLLEIYARRLQIQERLCQQVTAALDQYLEPLGSACVLTAKHLCMSGRGVGKQHSEMVTSSLTGVFREKGNGARQEFLSVI